jgi:hypothetical protein
MEGSDMDVKTVLVIIALILGIVALGVWLVDQF